MSQTFRAHQDPDEVKDWVLDWSLVLEEDQILSVSEQTLSSSDWVISVGDGLVIESQTNDTTTTTIWLSGGIAGTTYQLVNRVETSGGRTYDITMKLRCRNK